MKRLIVGLVLTLGIASSVFAASAENAAATVDQDTIVIAGRTIPKILIVPVLFSLAAAYDLHADRSPSGGALSDSYIRRGFAHATNTRKFKSVFLDPVANTHRKFARLIDSRVKKSTFFVPSMILKIFLMTDHLVRGEKSFVAQAKKRIAPYTKKGAEKVEQAFKACHDLKKKVVTYFDQNPKAAVVAALTGLVAVYYLYGPVTERLADRDGWLQPVVVTTVIGLLADRVVRGDKALIANLCSCSGKKNKGIVAKVRHFAAKLSTVFKGATQGA